MTGYLVELAINQLGFNINPKQKPAVAGFCLGASSTLNQKLQR
jgi:hypothetical protein